MKPENRLSKAIVILLLLFLSPQCLLATHYASAEVRADFIGLNAAGLTYKVTLTLYKVCESPGADLAQFEVITMSSKIKAFSRSKNLTAAQPDTLDQLCPQYSGTNSCRIPNSMFPGFVRRVYTDTIKLGADQVATDLTFSWVSGNRNGGIENLNNPSSLYIYVSCTINNVFRYNNSSPHYTANPVPYLCSGQPNFFYNYPIDADGDSLVTFNVQPRENDSTVAPYVAAYSVANPVASTSGYIVDPQTGRASFSIPNSGKYAIAFKTVEFDRATRQAIGSMTRDVQLCVLPCASSTPYFYRPINLSGTFFNSVNELIASARTPLSFDVPAGSHSAGKLVGTRQNVFPVASVTNITRPVPDSVNFHFSWTPTDADTGSHLLIFKVTDTTCTPTLTMNLTAYYAVTIRVEEGGPAGVPSVSNNARVVFPNPASNQLFLQTKNANEIKLLKIYTITGVEVLSIKDPVSPIDIKNLSSGMYIVRMTGSGFTNTITIRKN